MSHLTTDLFNSLYRKHYEQLFYYAYGFTDDVEVCRDILADVFVYVTEILPPFGRLNDKYK